MPKPRTKNKFGKYFKSPALIKFGERVRMYRSSKTKLSQEDFARKIGLHRTYLSAVERGEYNLTLMTVIAISQGLEVGVGELMVDLENLVAEDKEKPKSE